MTWKKKKMNPCVNVIDVSLIIIAELLCLFSVSEFLFVFPLQQSIQR